MLLPHLDAELLRDSAVPARGRTRAELLRQLRRDDRPVRHRLLHLDRVDGARIAGDQAREQRCEALSEQRRRHSRADGGGAAHSLRGRRDLRLAPSRRRDGAVRCRSRPGRVDRPARAQPRHGGLLPGRARSGRFDRRSSGGAQPVHDPERARLPERGLRARGLEHATAGRAPFSASAGRAARRSTRGTRSARSPCGGRGGAPRRGRAASGCSA